MATEIEKAPAPTPAEKYEDLSQIVRHLLGAMAQLEKAKHYDKRVYWTKAVNHWVSNATIVLKGGERFAPALSLQLATALDDNIKALYKDHRLESTIVDDLRYRLRAVYDSMVSLENCKISAIVLNHSNLKANIEARITELEERLNSEGDEIERSKLRAASLELRALTYVPQPKANEQATSESTQGAPSK
jgi:hypothetical protein